MQEAVFPSLPPQLVIKQMVMVIKIGGPLEASLFHLIFSSSKCELIEYA